MLESKLHRLLKRQLRKADISENEVEKFQDFFNSINKAYIAFDADMKHVEHILEESSHELFIANRALISKIDTVESIINNIVNTIEGVIFKTDLGGKFIYLNKAWKDLTGISIEEGLEKNYKDFLRVINHHEQKKLKRFLKKQRKDYKTLFKLFKPDGTTVWIQLKLILTFNPDNSPNGIIGTMMDVTQHKETVIELNQANKIKDEFLSTISHEIRTPLNAVIGMSEILLMENHLDNQKENFQVLKYSSEHLLSLINNLLDLNKFKSKEIKLIREDFNLSELIQNIELNFKLEATKKQLDFKTTMDENIPSMLKGDILKLSQVLSNLLSNAFKFTYKGGVSLSITILEKHSTLLKLRFSVGDSGIGVSYNKQKDIFKSFVQANDNISELYGGSGLGLYISKELLNIQDSVLKLKSEKGKGSTFWFDIVFQFSKKEITNKSNFEVPTGKIDIKVLVAEDNKINTLLLNKLFNRWQIKFMFTENGEELLDVYKNNDFDIILMDLQMPVLDGYETTNIIRNMKDTEKALIPIIALTAFSESEVFEKIERYKMNGYLSKPLKATKLHNVLSSYSLSIKIEP